MKRVYTIILLIVLLVYGGNAYSHTAYGYKAEMAQGDGPNDFSLAQNYPNPFNPSTTIKFTLPAEARVNLRVMNLLGEEVANIMNRTMPQGTHEVRFNASELSSGIYFYTIEAKTSDGGVFKSTRKMILTK